MHKVLVTLFLLHVAFCFDLSAQPRQLDPNVPALRKQVFGEYGPLIAEETYKFDSTTLVSFANGFFICKEEFMYVFNSAVRKDSSLETKTKFLDEYILGRQRMFEAFEQNLDTSMAFQLDFLKYKQEFITPYLNKGLTRVEAEALPEVKYALRAHYSGMILFELMMKELWTKANSTADQKTFFYAHPELYQGQPFEVSKTKVVHDYQKELETALNTRVQKKFAFAKNENLIKRL